MTGSTMANTEPLAESIPSEDGTEEMRRSDALVQAALDFLAELFPVADTRVTYTRNGKASVGEEGESQTGVPGLFRDVREVPGHPEFLRVVAVNVKGRLSRFLGEAAADYLETAYDRLVIPLELAHEWTEQVAASSREARKALRLQLPTHVIAHIVADQFAQVTGRADYRFAHHGEAQSPHDELAGTVVNSLEYMDGLTRSRVEHQELSHGLIVAPLAAEEPTLRKRQTLPQCCYPQDFQDLKRIPLLADGYQSALRISPGGEAVELVTRDTLGDMRALLDRDFGALSFIAAASERYEGIGLMLRPGGSVMTFAGGQPLFIRRSGVWHGLLWNQVRSTMVARYGKVGAQVFGVALILTTSSKGGILVIMDRPSDPPDLNEKDRVDRARERGADEQKHGGAQALGKDPQGRAVPAEWYLHRLLPTSDVTELSLPTLALLAGIDGATIVDTDGRLLSYGAIVPSVQGQSEGARTAAARTLSEHGLVIKVSEDGPVQLFENGESVLTV